jgi:hypothetical protein
MLPRWGKRPGPEADQTLSSSAKVKNVELYVHSLHAFVACTGTTVPFVAGVLSPGVQQTVYEADHSHPFSTETKNGWSYTTVLSYVFVAQKRTPLFHYMERVSVNFMSLLMAANCQYVVPSSSLVERYQRCAYVFIIFVPLFNLGDGGSRVLRNIVTFIPDYTASRHRRYQPLYLQ